MDYQIKRGGSVVATVHPEGGQEKEVMLKDIVPMAFKSHTHYIFAIGDYVTVYGETYYLNQLDEPKKNSTMSYEYKMTFQAAYYALGKPRLFFYNSANVLKIMKFEIMCNASMLLDLIVANANRTQSGWTRGYCVDSEYKMLPFDGESILQAMDQGAKEYGTEWWVVNKTINFYKKGVITGHKFMYGFDKGLRGGLQRTNVDARSVFSRLYVTGSDQNLPAGYRDGQGALMLPGTMDYIQSQKYGNDEIEVPINFPDIKPERIGTVTAVGSIYQFSDSGLDFDISLQLTGVSAKVQFITGNLSGYTFEIAEGGYNHATKTITFLKNEVEKSIELPSATIKPEIGDKWSIVDIIMPASYVTAAENRLLAKGQEYSDENHSPRVAYDVPPDPFYFRRNDIELTLGDYVNIEDEDLQVNKNIRVMSYVRDLHDPYKYGSLQISDVALAGASYTDGLVKAERTEKVLQINRINDIQRAKQNWRTTSELTTMIETIRAEMLLIMVAGGAYQTDIIAETNAGGNINGFATSAGILVHEEYLEHGGTWNVAAFYNTMPDAAPYYVYIKAVRETSAATIILSKTKFAVESDPSFYYFPFGIISSPILGKRILTSIKGYTRITGNQINTGKVVSNTGQSFLDLDLDQFFFGNETTGIDWNYTAAGKLTIRGALVQSASGVTAPLPVFRGAYYYLTTYYTGDTVSYGGSTWMYVYPTPIFNVTPAAGAYWALQALKGTDGTNGTNGIDGGKGDKGDTGTQGNYVEFQFAKNGSTSTAPEINTGVVNPPGWSTTQPALGPIEYMWMTSVVKTAAGALVGTWSTPARFNGEPGGKGDSGLQGPFITNRGNFDNSATYVGTNDRVEAIKYGGAFYVTRVDAGEIPAGTLPTDTSKWNAFGGTFESIATGLLLASAATIDNLTVRNLVTDVVDQKRVVISGTDNNIKLLNALNEVLNLIDDDSAIEYFNLDGSPVMGPGMRTGKEGGSNTSISSRGVTVVDSSGKKMWIRPDLIYSEGNIQINGFATVVGNLAFSGNMIVNGDAAINVTRDIRVGGDTFRRMTWRNGILISDVAL